MTARARTYASGGAHAFAHAHARFRQAATLAAAVIALMALALVVPGTAAAADFVQVGGNVDGPASAGDSKIAFDGTTAYIAYRENVGTVPSVLVKRWDGANWQQVGTALNTGGELRGSLDIIVPVAGMPYVTYGEWDGNKSRVYVKRFSGGTWQQVGASFLNWSGGNVTARDPSIAWYAGAPVVAWREDPPNNTSYMLRVKRWDGANWVLLGDALNTGIDTALTPRIEVLSGVPYAFWSEVDDLGVSQVYVRSWNGTEWSTSMSLNVDGTLDATLPEVTTGGGTLHVAFLQRDADGVNQLRVRRLGASGWSLLGGSLNRSQTSSAATPAISWVGGAPWVAFVEAGQAHASRWTGAYWKQETRYLNIILSANATVPSIAHDGTNPWVTWTESANVYAKRWDPAAIPPTTGSSTLVPESDRAGGTGTWQRNTYSGGCAMSTSNLYAAIREDVDSPSSGTCGSGGSYGGSAGYIETPTNEPSSVSYFELTDTPASTTVVQSINVRSYASKTGARDVTFRISVFKSDGTPVGTPVLHTATTSFSQFSYPIGSLSLTKADADGLYVMLEGFVSGSGQGSEVRIATINLDVAYDTTCQVAACPPDTPTNVSPSTYTNDPTPTLVATDYFENEGDAHVDSQWQVRTDAGTYSPAVEDTGPTSTSLTQHVMTSPLTDGDSYWFHVRYRDTDSLWSSWSTETKFTYDGSAPTGGLIAYPDGLVQGVTITTDPGTDPVSGIDMMSARIERRSAPYAGSCGSFGSWTQVGPFNVPSPWQDVVVPGTCYTYRYVVHDNAGNVATYSTGAIAIVQADTEAPSVPQLRRLADRSGTAVSMQWADSFDNQTPTYSLVYDVEASADGVSWLVACTGQPASAKSCGSSGLAAATPRYFRVRARDLAGNASPWGAYADVTNETIYLNNTASPQWASPVYQATTGVFGPDTTTFTQNTVGLTATQQFIPYAEGVTRSPSSLGPAPSGSGNGWFVQAAAGDGVNPGGINDGPITISATHYASKITGEAHVRPRLWRVATSAGAPSGSTLLHDFTGASNAYASTTPQTDTGVAPTYNYPWSFALDESLMLETFMTITTSAASPGGAMRVTLSQGTLQLAPPGIRPGDPTGLSPPDGSSGALPTIAANYQHPTGVAGHLVFEVRLDDGGNPGDLVETGYSAFERAAGTAGSYVPVGVVADGTYHWRVRSEDRFGRVSDWSAARTFVLVSSPVNGGLPIISGNLLPGQTLSTTPGTWTGAPTGYTYQWRRCDAAGANCADIGGATSSTYVLGAPDVGSTLRVVVVATNAFGSDSATSNATGIVTSPGTAPNAPAHVGLPDGSTTADTTPTLSATFSDANAPDTGTLQFEVCSVAMAAAQSCTGAGGSVLASGSTSAGIANGATASWTSGALANGTVYWHARAQDDGGLWGAWSASWTLVVGTPSLTIGVDAAAVSMSPASALPGTNATAVSQVTVTTNNATGYSLLAADASDTAGMEQPAVDTMPDWTGSVATPTSWTAATSGYFGVTVLCADSGPPCAGTGSKDTARWGTGWTASNFDDNLYAGLTTTATMIHARPTYDPAASTIMTAYRANASSNELAGSYTTTIDYTAVANP